LEYPEVPLTEYICLQDEELFHRNAPLADIGGEFRQKGSMNVLAEEDSLAVTIQPDCNGTGCITQDGDALEPIRYGENSIDTQDHSSYICKTKQDVISDSIIL